MLELCRCPNIYGPDCICVCVCHRAKLQQNPTNSRTSEDFTLNDIITNLRQKEILSLRASVHSVVMLIAFIEDNVTLEMKRWLRSAAH